MIVFGLQNVSHCKSCDISRLKDFFLFHLDSINKFSYVLLAAPVPQDTQASIVRRTLITASATVALSTAFVWTGSTTLPASACLDTKGRSVNWKQMSATASPARAAPPVWT